MIERADHREWMSRALALAGRCGQTQDVPVGAVVVDENGVIIGQGWNDREGSADPTAHAEIMALRQAGRSCGTWRLSQATLVVTLEPCPMCAGAAIAARIRTVVFGAWDEKAGACGSVWDLPRDRQITHRPQVVGGVMEAECGRLLVDFFARQRAERPGDLR